MSKLFIFIPFTSAQVNTATDCPAEALEFASTFAGLANKRIGDNIGNTITEGIQVVYSDSVFQVTANDYIIVFAHGNENVANTLYLNDPNLMTPVANVIAVLQQRNAGNAARILFMCCYSSLPNHIAILWKQAHMFQTVYGGSAAISTLYSATRLQIRSCCLALFPC